MGKKLEARLTLAVLLAPCDKVNKTPALRLKLQSCIGIYRGATHATLAI